MTFTLEVQGTGLPWFNAPVALVMGWNFIGGSFGVHLLDIGGGKYALRMNNGAVGRGQPGAFYFDKIILTVPDWVEIAPRVCHAVSNSTTPHSIIIGNGGEYFPTQAIKTVRFCMPGFRRWAYDVSLGWAGVTSAWHEMYTVRPVVTSHPMLALPKDLSTLKGTYDAIGERILKSLRTGIPDSGAQMYEPPMGMWNPIDLRDKGYVGGNGIEAFPGFELSSIYRLLSHDLTMERHAVACVDATTGEPLHEPRAGYRATRGWDVTTKLREFVEPLTGHPNEPQRRPIDLNAGFCSYRDALAPRDDLGSFYTWRWQPIDDEHLVRATRHAKCAAFLYNDPVAKYDLEQIAADAHMGVALNPFSPDHEGSDAYGRGLAWSLNAIECAALTRTWAFLAAARIVSELVRVQRPDGAIQRFLAGRQYSGWAPDPRTYPDYNGEDLNHTLEENYLALGLALAGHDLEANNSALFSTVTGQPRQWITMPSRVQLGEVESFSLWAVLGVLATGDHAGYWRERMKALSVPGGGPAGENVYASLLACGKPEACAKAIEALQP